MNDYKNNPEFKKYLNFLIKTEQYSEQQIKDLLLKNINRTLKNAYENVEFYNTKYTKRNLNKQINKISELKKYPLIDKNIVKDNLQKFISKKYNKNDLLSLTTGGSTGNPLKVYMDINFKSRNLANTYYYMKIAGFEPNKYKSVRLHGDIISEDNIKNGKYWYVENGKKLIMSINHITYDTIKLYCDKINEFKPEYIHAYPSAIYLIAKYISELNLEIKCDIKCIFCDCETLYKSQRRLLEKVFRCKIYLIYAHTEGSVYGFSCSYSDYYHILPTVGYVELLDKEGNEIIEEGQKGEIVVTGFINEVFPLIRYKTGDIGIKTNKKCSCGRNFQLLEDIEGRIQDYAVDKNNNLIALGPALFDYHFNWEGIKKFRIVQKEIGKLIFYISPKKKIDAEQLKKRIIKSFTELYSKQFEISVEIDMNLKPTKKGKYRYFLQYLNL